MTSKNYNLKLLSILFLYLLIIISLIFIYYNIRVSNIYVGEKLVDTWPSKISSCWKNSLNKGRVGCSNKIEINEKIIIVGDSHASQLWPGLDTIYNNKYDVVLVTSELLDGGMANWFSLDQMEFVENYVIANEVKYFIFTMAQHHLIENKINFINQLDRREAKVEEAINKFLRIVNNSKVKTKFIILNDTPRLSLNLPITTCIKQFKKFNKSDCGISKADAMESRENLSLLFNSFSDGSIINYDPFNIICPKKICNIILDDELMFIDQNHISAYGSTLIAIDMAKILR